MYRSSSLTFVYKYLFVPIWGGFFLVGIIANWTMKDAFSYNWTRGAALMVGWSLIWLTIMMIRLRSVEATEVKLIINTLMGEKSIDYVDIEWISQIALLNPILISLKYYDKETGVSKKILIMPSISSQLFRFNLFGEENMTKFIRKQIIKSKPDYSKDSEPSRWLPFGLVLITALPLVFIVDRFF